MSDDSNEVSPSEARRIMKDEEMRLDAEFFLKQLAKDPEMPIETLAQDIDPPIPVSRAKKIVQDFVMLLIGTVEEPDFPERIRRVYNDGAEPEDELTQQDMMSLLGLIEKYHDKMLSKKNADILSARMQNMGMPTVNQPSELARRRVSNIPVQVMKDSQPPEQSQPQPQPQQYPPQQYPPYQQYQYPPQQQQQQAPAQPQPQPQIMQPPAQAQVPYEDEDSLMKYLLEINHAIVPTQAWKIPNFMNVFKSMKPTWMADPSKLMFILKTTFGNIPGEAVYVQFSGMRNQVTNDPADLYRLTGVGSSPAANFIPTQSFRPMPTMQPMQGQYGQNAMGMDYDSESERRLDKWMERTVKANYMHMMQKMYENQQPANMGMGMQPGMGGIMGGINPADYDYFEDLDKDGRVVARRFVRKAIPTGFGPYGYPGQENGKDKTAEMMLEFFKTMQNQTNQTNHLLMEKMLSGNTPGDHGMGELMGTIVKQVMGAYTVQMNPAENFSRYLELGEKISQMKHASERPKSIEEKKLELDFMLAKNDMEVREREKSREFQRQQTEQENANRNVDTVINRVGDTITKLGEPLLNIALGGITRGMQGGGVQDPRVAAQLRAQQAAAAAQQQGQGPQQVIIHPPQQQQQQPVDPIMQMQMEEEANRRRYEEAYRQQEALARQQQQQQQQQAAEYDNRPIEEQLKDFDAEQIEEMAHRGQANLMEQERILNKVMAERARRKGYGGVPQRKYVSPIVSNIQEHEAQQVPQQQQQYQPDAGGIDVFDEIEEDVQMPQINEPNYNQPSMSAFDSSVPADSMIQMTEEEREELVGAGQISDTKEENLGIPSTANIEPEYQAPQEVKLRPETIKEPTTEEYEVDDSDLVDVE